MHFPEQFWWGTAASSTQSEGAAPASDYLDWERQGKVPPSQDGNGFARNYAEDFRLYAGLGLTHHRLSIEWARIEPAQGQRDPAEVDRCRAMLAARAAGISVWVCLHHFTLPRWFMAKGGFLDDAARRLYWRRHVDFVAEAFGDLVFGWKPVNEPAAYALAGWMLGQFPPGIRDRAQFYRALRAAHLANHEAWLSLRRGGKPVSTIMSLSPIFPLARAAAETADPARAERILKTFDDIWWGSWIRALRDGVLSLPGMEAERIPEMAGSFDLIGFSYYSALGVFPDGQTGPYPPGERVGPMGYVPWSAGLGVVIRRLAREFPDRPLLICEHRIGTADDSWRVQFLRDSIAEVGRALEEKIDLRGLFHWTGVDNYEWTFGFDVPFGLFDRDRNARPSAQLLASYARRALAQR